MKFDSYCNFYILFLFLFCQSFCVKSVIVDQGIFTHLTVQIGEEVQQPTQCEVTFGHLEVHKWQIGPVTNESEIFFHPPILYPLVVI